jgi:hypothetical protein
VIWNRIFFRFKKAFSHTKKKGETTFHLYNDIQNNARARNITEYHIRKGEREIKRERNATSATTRYHQYYHREKKRPPHREEEEERGEVDGWKKIHDDGDVVVVERFED